MACKMQHTIIEIINLFDDLIVGLAPPNAWTQGQETPVITPTLRAAAEKRGLHARLSQVAIWFLECKYLDIGLDCALLPPLDSCIFYDTLSLFAD